VTEEEKALAFGAAIQKVMRRYRKEFEMTKIAMVGVLFTILNDLTK